MKASATQNPVVRFGTVEHVIRMEQFSLSQGGQTIATRTQLPLSHGWGARPRVEPSLTRGARPGYTPLVLRYPFTSRDRCSRTYLPRAPTRHSAEHP